MREDGNGEVQIADLEEVPVASADELMQLIDEGNSVRTTQKTEANDTSSRSHAICQIVLRARAAARAAGTGKVLGKMSLVVLAGSERGTDTKQHNRQLRTESAEINKSLLALKECIRGLDQGKTHVPLRGSKLTEVRSPAPADRGGGYFEARLRPGVTWVGGDLQVSILVETKDSAGRVIVVHDPRV